jgi:hypothetical protein
MRALTARVALRATRRALAWRMWRLVGTGPDFATLNRNASCLGGFGLGFGFGGLSPLPGDALGSAPVVGPVVEPDVAGPALGGVVDGSPPVQDASSTAAATSRRAAGRSDVGGRVGPAKTGAAYRSETKRLKEGKLVSRPRC